MRSDRVEGLAVKLRILISMIQVLSQLGLVYSIPYPVYSSLLRWVGLLQFDLVNVLPLDCIMTFTFTRRYCFAPSCCLHLACSPWL